jgi:transposase
MSNFRQFDRATGFLLPPSLDEWLPERHLARFVVEVIDGLDLSAMVKSYRGSGSAGYHPALLLGLLVYGYTTGVFSSRKLERATYDSVAFRFIAANDHPDHDTIATFRRRFLKDIEALFVRVLELAREMGLLRLGTVGLDGTKIHANASRHSALSYEHAGKIEAQLKAEVAELLARAEAADQADVSDGMSIPEELARREERLAKLAEARAKLEARAKERFEREMAEHRAKLAARDEKTAASGKKPGGSPPAPPLEGPQPKDQINLTDEDSRIMPVAGGGFEQCYNAQAVVATESLLVIATDVVQAPNDKQQIAPMLEKVDALPEQLGRRDRAAAASSLLARTLCRAASGAGKPDTGRSHGLASADTARQTTLRSAQADPGAGVRHHQIGDGIPPIPAARARLRPRRVEPRHHGLEHQADACAQPRLSAFDTRLDRGLVSGNLPPAAIHNRRDDFQQT